MGVTIAEWREGKDRPDVQTKVIREIFEEESKRAVPPLSSADIDGLVDAVSKFAFQNAPKRNRFLRRWYKARQKRVV